jgi:hypothetical protein
MQREAHAEQRTPWASSAPSGRRPPRAPRERKPALAALAILLIAGGALGTGYLVLQNGKRVGAIEVSSVIAAGQQIKLGDLSDVQVAANTGLPFVPWTEVQQVTQFYAKTTLYPGTLFTAQMAVASSGLTGTSARAGIALKDGQFPDQLQVGDIVDIFADSSSTSTSGGCIVPAGVSPTLLARDATVLDISSPPSGSTNLDVTVGINPADQYLVTCNAAAGNVSVVIQPGKGLGAATGPSPGSTLPPPTPSTNPTSRTSRGHSSRPSGHSSPPSTSKSSPPATTSARSSTRSR